MVIDTFRTFVQEILREAAVTPAAAGTAGLALMIVRRGADIRGVVLYDPARTVRRAREKFDDHQRFRSVNVSVVGAVYCAYTRRACGDDVRSIDRSAARSGYGPLLYDVMLSQGLWITPDRRSVSDSASAVWKHYWERRRGDVLRRMLPDDGECIMHADDRPWLNYAYSLGVPVDVSRLNDAHERAVAAIVQAAKVRDVPFNDFECENVISAAGWDFEG